MRAKFKWAVMILLSLAVLAFAVGCGKGAQGGTAEDEVFDDKVYSVSIRYNGKEVDVLPVDLSAGTVLLKAVVDEGDDSMAEVSFKSSDRAVATVEKSGRVTLKKAGETVITATAGDKNYSMVLVVVDDRPVAGEEYALIVNGGTAMDSAGNEITSAKEGEYFYIVPDLPEHTRFVKWEINAEDDIWNNGNAFKMPAGRLTITARYTYIKYRLNLIGSRVTKAGDTVDPAGTVVMISNEGRLETMLQYDFTYDTEITIKADAAPSEDEMFVGFDHNTKNNRVGTGGVGEYTFHMGDEETTITAVYSEMNKNVLTNTTFSAKAVQPNITAAKYDSSNPSTDADLEGLYGYRFSIPADTKAISTYPENIASTNPSTPISDFETSTLKVIFKNTGAYDLSVELYVSYFGNLTTTGVVEVRKGKTATAFMNGLMCVPGNTSWGFAVRGNVGGASSAFVTLDAVVASAHTYPSGYLLLNAKEEPDYMQFTGSASRIKMSQGRAESHSEVGGLFWSTRASTITLGEAYVSAQINLTGYSGKKTVYIRIFSLINDVEEPRNEFTLLFRTGTSSVAGNPYSAEGTDVTRPIQVSVTKQNETMLYKVVLDEIPAGNMLYVCVAKPTIESGMSYSTFMQFAYNNVFGYKE